MGLAGPPTLGCLTFLKRIRERRHRSDARSSLYGQGGSTLRTGSPAPMKGKPLNQYKRVMAARREGFREYLRTDTWQRKRARVLERDKHTCRVVTCNAKTGLHVHHLRYPKQLGAEPLVWLVTVCEAHHALIHKRARRRGVDLTEASTSVLEGRSAIPKTKKR